MIESFKNDLQHLVHYFDLVVGVVKETQVVDKAGDAHVEVVDRFFILEDDVVEVAPQLLGIVLAIAIDAHPHDLDHFPRLLGT